MDHKITITFDSYDEFNEWLDGLRVPPLPKIQLFTLTECAELLKVSRRTIQRYIAEGTLKGSMIEKGWKVSAAELQRFIEEHRTEPEKRPDAFGRGGETE